MVPRVQVVPLPDEQVSFTVDGLDRLRWNADPRNSRPFLFPLVGPAGRNLLRIAQPNDGGQGSQRGLWWGHGQVHGVDFWREPRDVPTRATIRQDQIVSTQDGEFDAAVVVDLGWYDLHNVRLLRQRLALMLRPMSEGECWLELQADFSTELESLSIGESSLGWLGIRLLPSMSVASGKGAITNSHGKRGESSVHGQRAAWVDMSGPVTLQAVEGLTIFDHPENPGSPVGWNARAVGWMGPAASQQQSMQLVPGQVARFRYGVHVHRGLVDIDRASDLHVQFGQAKSWVIAGGGWPGHRSIHEG